MILLILQCVNKTSFSIKNEYLKFSVFSMRISENNEKWVWNIIFILFCAVVVMSKHSNLIKEKIVVWINRLIASSRIIEIKSSSRLIKTWFESEFWNQVFKLSHYVDIKYWFEFSTRLIKIWFTTTNIYLIMQ